jgi:3-hydroxybutyryl-CoA dehydrogenase
MTGIGKRAIVVTDGPGFVANRVLMAAINEAIAGVADATTVEQVFEDCLGHALGPLRTADLIGLDVILDSLVVLRVYTGNPAYTPCPLLTELVGKGELGRKTGFPFLPGGRLNVNHLPIPGHGLFAPRLDFRNGLARVAD